MNVYLFERLFNLGNNYARMRSCRVEGHSQIDLKGLKNDKISLKIKCQNLPKIFQLFQESNKQQQMT